jgi:hypothetical protein
VIEIGDAFGEGPLVLQADFISHVAGSMEG